MTSRALAATAEVRAEAVRMRGFLRAAETQATKVIDMIDAEPAPVTGIWTSPAELAALPTEGPAWEALLAESQRDIGTVDLADQDSRGNVMCLAKALVYARTKDRLCLDDVIRALGQVATGGTYAGRALALGRELCAYVIAADLIDLPAHDPGIDATFRGALVALRTTPTSGAATSLVHAHETRPNNWGTHAGATRSAIAAYLGDDADLERTAQVFRGYLGERQSYAFGDSDFGGPADAIDNSWQADPGAMVGVNAAGSTIDGRNVDGVLPDDQRRGGPFTWPPPKENYVWEALQGAVAQALILSRAGYPSWEWGDRAILRAVTWLHDVAHYPAEGDDTWIPWLVNWAYGSAFPATAPAGRGKNVGFTDWTHGRETSA